MLKDFENVVMSCFFHLYQSIYRNMQNNDLVNRYTTNESLETKLHVILTVIKKNCKVYSCRNKQGGRQETTY